MHYRSLQRWLMVLVCIWFAKARLTLPASAADVPADPGEPTVSLLTEPFSSVVFVRYSPDGRELACIPQFGPVLLASTTNFNRMRTFSVGMRMVAYSADGTRMATAEGTDGARIWDAAVAGKLMRRSTRREVLLLEDPLQVLEPPSKDPKQVVFWIEFSADGKRLLTTQANGRVRVWNTSSWKVEEEIAVAEGEVRSAAFSPDGKMLAFGDSKGMLHRWSFEKKAALEPTRTPGAVIGTVFAPHGKLLVTTHQTPSNTVAMLWNPDEFGVAEVQSGFGSATFSKDGRMLALGGRNIRLMDPVSRKEIRTIALPDVTMADAYPDRKNDARADRVIPVRIQHLAFSPDGRALAVGCLGAPMRLLKWGP